MKAIRCALLSVSDKTGLIPFAKALVKRNIQLISTGGTHLHLKEAGIPSQEIAQITQFPEMMEGRVKSLHPIIFGGILGKRDSHHEDAQQHQIPWIDLVIVNLYPFKQFLSEPEKSAIEQIDIGGAALIRAAAKNKDWVGVITNPADYSNILLEIDQHQTLTSKTRQQLAYKAFLYTAQYDALIAHYLNDDKTQPNPLISLTPSIPLRYGENPHQTAFAYTTNFPYTENSSLLLARQHQGKPLSYNNLIDADAALSCVREFSEPACVIVKHTNPCGVAISSQIENAWKFALEADPISAFGGIAAFNQPCDQTLAEQLISIFLEVVIAPAYTQEALKLLAQKPNLRLLEISTEPNLKPSYEIKSIQGGVLLQEKDNHSFKEDELKVVTQMKPSPEIYSTLRFAWKIVKHLKSNAIAVAQSGKLLGVGAGQTSRIQAVELALKKPRTFPANTVLASDAFFPFRDSIDRIAQTSVRTIIQPGGSLKDQEVIDACNEHQIAMVFTGKRCFKH